MQYFGYLRRKPNDAPEPGLNFDGYNFWLGKLFNEFDGNFVNAEMVKAFHHFRLSTGNASDRELFRNKEREQARLPDPRELFFRLLG